MITRNPQNVSQQDEVFIALRGNPQGSDYLFLLKIQAEDLTRSDYLKIL